MKKVYCKKDFDSYRWDRCYYKGKPYFVIDEYVSQHESFVFLDDSIEEGLWFSAEHFNEHFTYFNFIRQQKLERIIGV